RDRRHAARLRLSRGEGGAGDHRAVARSMARGRPFQVLASRHGPARPPVPGGCTVHRCVARAAHAGLPGGGRRPVRRRHRRADRRERRSHMKYRRALDQGTSSSRSIVFDLQGNIVSMAQQEFRQIYPQPGWVEHDPEEIWSSQLATARRAIAESGIALGDIAGLGITNQRETTLVWNRRTGQPIHNAIVWQDRRSEPICAALREIGAESEVRERTGLIIDAYFSGTKIQWLLDHVPGARAQAEAGELAFGTVDTWLIWKLTGGRLHVTDVTNASRTMLYNVRTG